MTDTWRHYDWPVLETDDDDIVILCPYVYPCYLCSLRDVGDYDRLLEIHSIPTTTMRPLMTLTETTTIYHYGIAVVTAGLWCGRYKFICWAGHSFFSDRWLMLLMMTIRHWCSHFHSEILHCAISVFGGLVWHWLNSDVVSHYCCVLIRWPLTFYSIHCWWYSVEVFDDWFVNWRDIFLLTDVILMTLMSAAMTV